jgi:hypothetical protein
MTMSKFAKVMWGDIFSKKGLLDPITSDRGKLFVSKFWRETLRLLKIESRMSTPYHPQTNGQTERINQSLKGYLERRITPQWRQRRLEEGKEGKDREGRGIPPPGVSKQALLWPLSFLRSRGGDFLRKVAASLVVARAPTFSLLDLVATAEKLGKGTPCKTRQGDHLGNGCRLDLGIMDLCKWARMRPVTKGHGRLRILTFKNLTVLALRWASARREQLFADERDTPYKTGS